MFQYDDITDSSSDDRHGFDAKKFPSFPTSSDDDDDDDGDDSDSHQEQKQQENTMKQKVEPEEQKQSSHLTVHIARESKFWNCSFSTCFLWKDHSQQYTRRNTKNIKNTKKETFDTKKV